MSLALDNFTARCVRAQALGAYSDAISPVLVKAHEVGKWRQTLLHPAVCGFLVSSSNQMSKALDFVNEPGDQIKYDISFRPLDALEFIIGDKVSELVLDQWKKYVHESDKYSPAQIESFNEGMGTATVYFTIDAILDAELSIDWFVALFNKYQPAS